MSKKSHPADDLLSWTCIKPGISGRCGTFTFSDTFNMLLKITAGMWWRTERHTVIKIAAEMLFTSPTTIRCSKLLEFCLCSKLLEFCLYCMYLDSGWLITSFEYFMANDNLVTNKTESLSESHSSSTHMAESCDVQVLVLKNDNSL